MKTNIIFVIFLIPFLVLMGCRTPVDPDTKPEDEVEDEESFWDDIETHLGHLGEEFDLPAGTMKNWAANFSGEAFLTPVLEKHTSEGTIYEGFKTLRLDESETEYPGVRIGYFDEELLYPWNDFFSNEGISSTEENLLIQRFNAITIFDDDEEFVFYGLLFRRYSNTISVYWMFANTDANISGSYIESARTIYINLELKEGWNRIINVFDEDTRDRRLYVGPEPENVEWIYEFFD